MAVAVSRSPLNFFEDVAYALSQLGRQHLKSSSELLKQYAVEMTFLSLYLLALVKAYVFMSFLSCLTGSLAAWMEKERVVSLLSHH